MSNRQLEQLRTDMMAGFATVRDEIRAVQQAMLPRELYNVEQRQMRDDMADMQQRLSKLETSNIDLNTQLLSVKQAAAQTPQQISGASTQLRYETTKQALDVLVKCLFAVGGAVLTWIAYHH